MECSFFFFFSFIFLKNSCYSNMDWWERTEVMQKEKAGLKCWKQNQKPNQQKRTPKRLTTASHRIRWPGEGGHRQGSRASMQTETRAKRRPWRPAKWGIKPKCQCLCLCVSVCAWGRGRREEWGIKARGQTEQEGKQAYIRELEGFQETARSEGFNTWHEHQPRFKNKNKGWQVLVTFWGKQDIE